jgi:capsular polysaccharide biosynthesis protein
MVSDTTAPLDQYLKPIKDHATLIGAVTALVTLLGVLVSTMVPTSYEATASVLVTPISTDPSETFESDVVVDMSTEERIATSKTVIALVSQRLAEQSVDIGHDALGLNVTVSSPTESRILDVSYQAATPSLAQIGADTFAQTYLDYRSQVAEENKSAAEEILGERIALLKDQLASIEAELTGFEEGSQSFVSLSVERESIRSELNAQQDTMAQLSTLSTDVGRIISPAELPDSALGLGPFVIILGALVGGLVMGCLAAYVVATIKAAGAPRNRRATDQPGNADPSTQCILETPDILETPSTQKTPDIQKTPSVLETPSTQKTPDIQKTPSVLETPSTLETPSVLETPSTQKTPSTLETYASRAEQSAERGPAPDPTPWAPSEPGPEVLAAATSEPEPTWLTPDLIPLTPVLTPLTPEPTPTATSGPEPTPLSPEPEPAPLSPEPTPTATSKRAPTSPTLDPPETASPKPDRPHRGEIEQPVPPRPMSVWGSAPVHDPTADETADLLPSAPPTNEPEREPAHHEPPTTRPARGSRSMVAEQQAMDAFFGPEPTATDKSWARDKPTATDESWAGDEPVDDDSVAKPEHLEPHLDSAWDEGFLDQSIHERSIDAESFGSEEGAEQFIDPTYTDPPDDGAESPGKSLDAVAAETRAALAALLEEASPDVGPIRGSDSDDATPATAGEALSQDDIDDPEAGWQIHAGVQHRDEQRNETAEDSGFEIDSPAPGKRQMTDTDALDATPPSQLAEPPALLSEASFEPLLQRFRQLEEGRALSVVCLGEAGRDASLAIGFGLTDELQSRGIKVLVVDMLLEEPAIDRLLGLPPQPGLLDVLAEQATLDEGARGITGLGTLRALTVGHQDDLADRRRTNELINGWSMQQLLNDAGTDYDATVIIGGTLDDARRLNLVLQQTDGIVIGTGQIVGEPAGPGLDARLAGLPAEVLALVSVDAAFAADGVATSGAPSM